MAKDEVLSRTPPRRDSWVSTRWSVIASLDPPETPEWETSWTYLVETYSPLMVRFVARILARAGGNTAAPADAEDVVQGFLASCVEKDWLTRADALKGKFRAYVQTLLRRYTYGYLRYLRSKGRSPPPGVHVFPVQEADRVDELTPEEHAEAQEFDTGWVKIAFDQALQRLGQESERYQAVILDLLATDGKGSPDLMARLKVHRAQLSVIKHRA